MADNESETFDDDESIAFVGKPEEKSNLDLSKPLWLIEIYYSTGVTQHIVNADTEREALAAGIVGARDNGEPYMRADRIEVAHIEMPERGDKNAT